MAAQVIEEGSSIIKYADWDTNQELFFQVVKPKPTLILVGGVHIAIPLSKLANTLGFEVIVIDPRKLFSTQERFPEVKSLFPEWPDTAFNKIEIDKSTAVVMLTHDPKIDDPALKIALESSAFYVGALGSKKTHQKRIERLEGAGIDREKLDRIHAPVGLDLGGRSPEEIALSIISQVVKVWNSQV
jgi:xanthine dehydrogenase accessory factor